MTEQSKALIRRYAEEVWNQGNLNAIDDLFAPEHVYHDPVLTGLASGPEGVREKCRTYMQAFPDGRVACDELLAEGDLVALLWTYSGTHTGDMLGIAPTGRRAEAQGVHLCRIREGKIVETTVTWNALDFLQQLGLVAEVTATASA
jgi:steroid delta-isomerase-like uncharacterized protein